MAHRHRLRRGVPPRISDRDERLLRRLIVRAQALVPDAIRNGEPFSAAADRAGDAVLPPGHRSNPDSPFVALIRLGKRWLLIPVAERPGQAAMLKDLAEQCAEVLDGQPGELKRVRKDIDE